MIMLTTTAIDVDEELLNRCLVLTVDEGREQTRAIHARQRRAQTLAGMLEKRERAAHPPASPKRAAAPPAAHRRQPLRREPRLCRPQDAHAAATT